jgi:acyl dehydratase
LDITFAQPEADAAYALTVQPNWFTLDRVAARTATGFKVEFQTAAPAGATLDWQLLR